MDCWISVTKPLHYEAIVTTKKVTSYIVITFIATAVYASSTILILQRSDTIIVANETDHHSNVTDNLITLALHPAALATMWTFVLAVLLMNVITVGIYTVVLNVLKKQIQKIQPTINNEAQQRPRTMYKGIIKLLFIMIYFTLNYGLAGMLTLMQVIGVITLEQVSSRKYQVFEHLYTVLAMTPCFVNIIFYGLTNNQFKHELKRIVQTETSVNT